MALSPLDVDKYLDEALEFLDLYNSNSNGALPQQQQQDHSYHKQQQQQLEKHMSKLNAMMSAEDGPCWDELSRGDTESVIGTIRPDLNGQDYDPVPAGDGHCLVCEQPFSNSTCQPGYCTANYFKDVPSFPSPEPGSEQQLMAAKSQEGLEVR